jgi:hypothetical protein
MGAKLVQIVSNRGDIYGLDELGRMWRWSCDDFYWVLVSEGPRL